jgi:hypothetical protein
MRKWNHITFSATSTVFVYFYGATYARALFLDPWLSEKTHKLPWLDTKRLIRAFSYLLLDGEEELVLDIAPV